MKVPNMYLVKQEKALTIENMSESRNSKGIVTVLKIRRGKYKPNLICENELDWK